ncbi:MAG TPA: hypothetical protein VLV90_01270 [Burkholderiales bacterium]|nr:hypothetical protein [Burkholderiales bacterium]
MRIYLPGEAWDPGRFPAVLAIGDSWFWYPFNNLPMAMAQHPRLKAPYRNIQIVGFNGAPATDYVVWKGKRGKYAGEVERQVSPSNAQYYSVVMISGGGNDAIDWGLALKQKCAGIADPGQCLDLAGLQGLLDEIAGCLRILLGQVAAAFAGHAVSVFLHGYDYPVPDGRGFTLAGLKVTGPWLQPALQAAGVDPALGLAVCHRLIDALNGTIAGLADPAKNIYHVNSLGVLDFSPGNYRHDWANEMHPTVAGFARIVDQRWIPVLAGAGIAS